jgi:hypothetical protein
MPKPINQRQPSANRREPSPIGFRLSILLFAILLGAQCVWLLLPELLWPRIYQLPIDATATTDKQHAAADWAASIATVRGDLWAESAFTYAALIVNPSGPAASSRDLTSALASARTSLCRALEHAPTQSSAWLLLAGLALRYPSAQHALDPAEVLKMSYYTGPSEQNLIPLRFGMAVRANKFNDVEMSQFISRDLRLLLQQKQIAVIVNAYNAASPDGKHFIEQAVGDIDPAALTMLHNAAKR